MSQAPAAAAERRTLAGACARILRLPGSRAAWTAPVLVILLAAAAPSLGLSPYWIIQVQEIAILALIVSGLNLSYGYAGELALGQVAIYAVGAYLAGYMALHGMNDLALTLIAAGLVAGAVGVISGIPGMRLGGWALAMVSFFLILLIPDVVLSLTSITGGYNGLAGIPAVELVGHTLTSRQLYWATLLVLLGWLMFERNFVESRHGAALRVLKTSPVLASSLGVPVYRLKVIAYGLGGIPAGLAGVLFAYQQQFVSADAFTFTAAVGVIAGSVIGGVDSVYGALAGAALLQIGPQQASNFDKFSSIVYGAVLIIGGVVFAGGLAGGARKLLHYLDGAASRWAGEPSARHHPVLPYAESLHEEDLSESAPAVTHGGEAQLTARDTTGAAAGGAGGSAGDGVDRPGDAGWVGGRGLKLEVRNATRRFGGVLALDDVSVVAQPRRITALIGSNGSGKTTMLNGISGLVRFDSGSALLGDDEVSHLAPHRIARLGVSRTFQTPSIPPSQPVWQVVAGSRYVRPRVGIMGAVVRSREYRRVTLADRRVANDALDLVGIRHMGDEVAASLSLGMQRLVEVARALAASPSVILLDEPASGLETTEIEQLAQCLRDLRAHGQTVVLVEHNFRFVLNLADDIYLLDRGVVLAAGSPQEVLANDAAMSSYLGRARARHQPGSISPDKEARTP